MRAGDFWSRRKAQVEAEAAEEARAAEAAALAEAEAQQAEKSDEELLEELGLPHPDTLQNGDDFQAFMAKAVPERLRRRALRRLWMSNPVLANVDGLVDYGEDFTDSAMVIEGMQTAYQVGKGMLKHIEAMAAEAEAKAAAEAKAEAEAEAEADEAPDEEHAEIQEPDVVMAEAVASQGATEAELEPEAGRETDVAAPPARRSLRFAFDAHETTSEARAS